MDFSKPIILHGEIMEKHISNYTLEEVIFCFEKSGYVFLPILMPLELLQKDLSDLIKNGDALNLEDSRKLK